MHMRMVGTIMSMFGWCIEVYLELVRAGVCFVGTSQSL